MVTKTAKRHYHRWSNDDVELLGDTVRKVNGRREDTSREDMWAAVIWILFDASGGRIRVTKKAASEKWREVCMAQNGAAGEASMCTTSSEVASILRGIQGDIVRMSRVLASICEDLGIQRLP